VANSFSPKRSILIKWNICTFIFLVSNYFTFLC